MMLHCNTPSKNPLFHAPYKALALVFFVAFTLWFEIYPRSEIYTHHLRDPDHFMRLNEVINWLQGQSWYDLSVPRMSPGGHTVVHWSRLIDIPIAALTLALSPWLHISEAALAASFVIPFMWFGVLLLLVPVLAEPFVGKEQKNLAILSLLFAPMLLFCYTPGNVDHHGIQVLIAGFGALSLIRILQNREAKLFAVFSAIAFACGFWIGAEITPWAILFMTVLGIAAAVGKEHLRKHAVLFGISLAVSTTALIPLALPASEYSSRAVSWFSPAYAIFATLCGMVFICEWAVGKRVSSKIMRFALAGLAAAGAAVAFFTFVPQAIEGAFADYDVFDATTVLDSITEAQPLRHAFNINRLALITIWPALANAIHLLVVPVTALGLCAYEGKASRNGTRAAWIVQGTFLAAAIALTLFWQMRAGKFMNMFALPPIAYLLYRWNERLKEKPQEITILVAQMAVFMVLGPMSSWADSSIRSMGTGPEAISPAAKKFCLLEPVIPTLTDHDALGKKPLTIMNLGDTGPELLFRTPHKVVSGNFNVPGNIDAYNFFISGNEETSLRAAKKWDAELVLVCKNIPALLRGKNLSKNARMVKGEDGIFRLRHPGSDQPLIEKIIDSHPPSWLRPVEIYETSDYLLYRIEYPKGYE